MPLLVWYRNINCPVVNNSRKCPRNKVQIFKKKYGVFFWVCGEINSDCEDEGCQRIFFLMILRKLLEGTRKLWNPSFKRIESAICQANKRKIYLKILPNILWLSIMINCPGKQNYISLNIGFIACRTVENLTNWTRFDNILQRKIFNFNSFRSDLCIIQLSISFMQCVPDIESDFNIGKSKKIGQPTYFMTPNRSAYFRLSANSLHNT